MQFLYNFFGTIMRWIYETVSAAGSEPVNVSYFAITLILMAVLSKMITMPLTFRMTKAAKKTQDLGPQLEALRKKYSYDERILQQKTMEFYKENNVSQAGCSSCLPMLVQLIVLLGLFGVIRQPALYLFDTEQEFLNIAKNFFWISDLAQENTQGFAYIFQENILWVILPLLNAVLQFVLQKMNPQTQQQNNAMGNQMNTMLILMPFMFFFISISWAQGLLLYWVAGNIIEIAVRGIMMVFIKKEDDNTPVKTV